MFDEVRTMGMIVAAQNAGSGTSGFYGMGLPGFIGILFAVLAVVAILVAIDILSGDDDREIWR